MIIIKICLLKWNYTYLKALMINVLLLLYLTYISLCFVNMKIPARKKWNETYKIYLMKHCKTRMQSIFPYINENNKFKIINNVYKN